VLAEMTRRRCDAILATAAAAEYATPFAHRLGFPEVLATSSDPGRGEENLGATKARAVADLVRSRGWSGRPLLVFTDHRDDLPLIGLATGLVWFGDPAALAAIVDAAPDLRAIAASGHDGSDVFDYFGDLVGTGNAAGEGLFQTPK
jgi:phosphoserine phosphatase